MPRKTVRVAYAVSVGNQMIANSADHDVDFRLGVIAMLERLLHDTNNYRGYGYLPSELTGEGKLKPNYDDTRRHYSYRED